MTPRPLPDTMRYHPDYETGNARRCFDPTNASRCAVPTHGESYDTPAKAHLAYEKYVKAFGGTAVPVPLTKDAPNPQQLPDSV